MRHAPVHTIGLPATPEAEQELPLIEEVTRSAGAVLLIGAESADFFIKRYGRLPANTEVYVADSLPARDMPSVGDVLEKVFLSGMQLGKSLHVQELLEGWPARDQQEVEDEPLPAIRAQLIKPMRQRPAAQWKRERNGRTAR